MKTSTGIVILTLAAGLASGQRVRRDLPRFMGANVTVTEPDTDADGFFPKGPATVCVELKPQRQCYTAPKDFGLRPRISVIEVDKNTPALFFAVTSGGVSGFTYHFALLRPGNGKALEDLFATNTSISNQSEHEFRSERSISGAPIFLTADYTVGPDEYHFGLHRYMVSTYIRQPSTMVDNDLYYLHDRYLTIRKYDQDVKSEILATEWPEILARLRRIKAAPPPPANPTPGAACYLWRAESGGPLRQVSRPGLRLRRGTSD